MRNGLYRVTTSYLCAGFLMHDNQVVYCAPILLRRFGYWVTRARRISD